MNTYEKMLIHKIEESNIWPRISIQSQSAIHYSLIQWKSRRLHLEDSHVSGI